MRLLLSSHGAGPYGAETMLIALARGLSSRGYELVLEFPHPGPAVESARELHGPEVRVTGRHRLPRNVREASRHFLGIPASVARIARLTRALRPDVVWVNSIYNPWAAVGARLAGGRVVWHLHERNLRGPAGLAVAMIIGLAACRVVAVSDHIAGAYRRFPWLRDRVRTIRNPLVGNVAAARGKGGPPFTVGYVGQLERRKRPSDLVLAIRSLPGVHAVLVGDGKARAEVERTVRRAGVADRVEMRGYRSDARSELVDFDCLAIPSLGEGFGLTALEAMAAGIPVVAARSGALPEVLGDAALYHAPGSPRELADRIEQLRTDAALRRQLREIGLQRVAQFDSGAWLDAVERVLHEVTDGKGRGNDI